jgi:hypothetical protein
MHPQRVGARVPEAVADAVEVTDGGHALA